MFHFFPAPIPPCWTVPPSQKPGGRSSSVVLMVGQVLEKAKVLRPEVQTKSQKFTVWLRRVLELPRLWFSVEPNFYTPGSTNIAGWKMDPFGGVLLYTQKKTWGYSSQLCDRLPEGTFPLCTSYIFNNHKHPMILIAIVTSCDGFLQKGTANYSKGISCI